VGDADFLTTVGQKAQRGQEYASININTPYDSGKSLKKGTKGKSNSFYTTVHKQDLFDDYQNPGQKLVGKIRFM